jgi:hypothetical protein
MLVLDFQLIVRVSALNILLELDYHVDIIFIIYKVIRNIFLEYLEVYAQGLLSFVPKVLLFILNFLSPLGLLSKFL